MPITHEKQNRILTYWFGEDSLKPLANKNIWFNKEEDVDRIVSEMFTDMLEDAANSAFDDWPRTASGALALVILCDQIPRHIYRGDELAFAQDHRALKSAQIAIDHGFEKYYSIVQRCFLYLPFEHTENLDLQNQSVELFTRLLEEAYDPEEKIFIEEALDYAVQHRNIIQRFGRFPHRNEILGRASSRDERDFLRRAGSSF